MDHTSYLFTLVEEFGKIPASHSRSSHPISDGFIECQHIFLISLCNFVNSARSVRLVSEPVNLLQPSSSTGRLSSWPTRVPPMAPLSIAFATPISIVPSQNRPAFRTSPPKRSRRPIDTFTTSTSPRLTKPASRFTPTATLAETPPSPSAADEPVSPVHDGKKQVPRSQERSKIMLTRRVSTHTLRRRLAKVAHNQPSLSSSSSNSNGSPRSAFPSLSSFSPPPTSSPISSTTVGFNSSNQSKNAATSVSTPPSSQSTGSAPIPLQTLLGQAITPDSTSLESMLSPKELVGTFIFHRVYSPVAKRRRTADPLNKYLRLSYALVEPFSNYARNCSNPRANGSIKNWYQTASKWNVLSSDHRSPLILKPSQRVYDVKDSFSQKTKLINSQSKLHPHHKHTILPSSHHGNKAHGEKTDEYVISPLLQQSRWDRALGRSPRIIAIGDVHGCIDELQQLLRLANYQAGDQIILCGDVLGKGPASPSVVQLSREIGAKSVRGNHDHEVVRWWEAQRRGDYSASVSTEHARIAKKLSEEDHTWLLECPYFIECAEMDHLFVHAGFIPGVKLTQQNPRLMMNMRSILNDGSITAKSIEHCEWAKLWKGPQTVVFGHDAVRGLQEYEFAKGIDTGCVYGGRLTALLLPENRLISVAAKRAYVAPKRHRI